MGTVYLLGDWTRDGIYKIGVTRGDIEKRVKKLQTGNSGEIYIVDKFETNHPFIMEKMLHRKYFGDKVLNEWFELSMDARIKFRETCQELQETIDVLENDNYFFRKKYCRS